MYSIQYSEKAVKQLTKLNHEVVQRVYGVLNRITVRPYAFTKKLKSCPYYSLRVGSYRVIMDIREQKLIILVIEVGHRKNVYDGM